ncbi:MAG: glycosyltransferase family 4 protein [Longimicrobiales bacterium]
MSRPKILYVMGSLVANDVGEEMVTVLGRLSRSSFDPRVVTLGGREELKERIEEMKVRTYSLGLVGPLGALRAVGKVRNLIRTTGVDVVHGYGSWGGAVAQLAAPRDVGVVRSVSRPPKHEKDLRGRILRALERRARGRHRTRFVVPNEGSVGLAVRAYAAAEGHVTVLPTSIDVAAIRERVSRLTRDGARRLMGIGEAETVFVLMSNFDSGGGMDRILTGLSVARVEDPHMRIFVVGSGRYEGSTRWKAEELNLGDSVVFLGPGAESDPIWTAADVAIDATPWASWSRSALIAIAAGLPAVKMQAGVGGWSEELDESLPMISGQPEPFAGDLMRLAADGSLREDILAHGAKVSEEVDVGNVVEKLAELYASVIVRGDG